MPTRPLKVYLAGPEVFLVQAPEILARKREVCAQMGWEGLSPVDGEIPHGITDPAEMAQAIYSGNVAMMEQADAIIANISPFRGPHMDPGTAFEIGYFAGKGKPVMVYTQVAEELADRVGAWSGDMIKEDGQTRDRNNHLVEDFGLHENLMIEPSIDNQGIDADIVVSAVPLQQVFSCDQGFAAAARRLERVLSLAAAFQTTPVKRRKPGR